jgi:hypothetical protein
VHVPQFADLSAEDEARVRELIDLAEPVLAITELERAAGSPHRWAKIWVIHRGSLDLGLMVRPALSAVGLLRRKSRSSV